MKETTENLIVDAVIMFVLALFLVGGITYPKWAGHVEARNYVFSYDVAKGKTTIARQTYKEAVRRVCWEMYTRGYLVRRGSVDRSSFAKKERSCRSRGYHVKNWANIAEFDKVAPQHDQLCGKQKCEPLNSKGSCCVKGHSFLAWTEP